MIRKVGLGLTALSLFFVIAACNNVGNHGEGTSDTTANTAKNGSVTPAVNPLPAVPAGAGVFFRNLKDGQTVTSPFEVEMGIRGMSVDTAGIVKAGSGHHHMLIDAGDSVMTGTVIPADPHHLHFGKGQTNTELNLTPGKHTLALQFGDGIHRSYGSRMAASITINVKK